MVKYPLGIQSFEKLRKNGCVYIDKTDYVYKLAYSGTTAYFLARPRRFGKSLLCTTLCNFFEGKKELFEGLKISEIEKDWTRYPVFYLPLASGDFSKENALRNRLNNALDDFAERNGVVVDNPKLSLAEKFGTIVTRVYEKTGLQTVFIVDEYDNPLINSEHLDDDKKTYREFFTVLKDYDNYFRFVFLTGVTKFAKTSIFSGNNQPEDISMSPIYSAVCGVTHDELLSIFTDEIQDFAKQEDVTFDEMTSELYKWYDCYLFHERGEKVLNPVSLFNVLKNKDFQNYWYETGTPTILMKRIKNSNFDIKTLRCDVEYGKDELKNYKDDEFKTELIPLLYYTGYLTIKSYEKNFRTYTLGFPDYEVEMSFFNSLAKEFYFNDANPDGLEYTKFKEDFRKCDIESAIERFKALFCAIPYANDKSVRLVERDFQNVIYLVFTILGEFIVSEAHFSKGRADSILINNDYVYIFEFKIDQDAQTALNQIDIKNYAGRFAMDNRKIIKVGVSFSSTEKNIVDWVMKSE